LKRINLYYNNINDNISKRPLNEISHLCLLPLHTSRINNKIIFLKEQLEPEFREKDNTINYIDDDYNSSDEDEINDNIDEDIDFNNE
jgi:hypothetical protein